MTDFYFVKSARHNSSFSVVTDRQMEKLNVEDITPKIHTTPMFISADLLFRTEFVDTFIIYCHTKCHIQRSNGLLGTTIKLKAKSKHLQEHRLTASAKIKCSSCICCHTQFRALDLVTLSPRKSRH